MNEVNNLFIFTIKLIVILLVIQMDHQKLEENWNFLKLFLDYFISPKAHFTCWIGCDQKSSHFESIFGMN